MRLNIVGRCYFKIQTLQEILKTQKSTSGGVLCIFGSRTFVPISWMCKKQTSVSHNSTESEIVSLDAGLRMDGFTCARLVGFGCWSAGNDSQNTKTNPSVHTGNPVWKSKAYPRLNERWIRTWIYQTWIKFLRIVHFRRQRSCHKDDHQRQKSDDETRVPHPPSSSGLVIWQDQPGPKSPNQVCRIQKPSRRHSHKRQFHAWWMAQLVASIEHHERHHIFQKPFSFLSAGKFDMSKGSQEISSLGSPLAKAKACCLVSRQCVSVGQDCSSNPKSPVSTRDAKSGWYSVQHASGNRGMVQKILEVSQKRMPRETESTREKSFKTWKTHSDTMKAARKYRWTPKRCTSRYGRDLWLHRCRQHCTSTRVTKRILNYSRILILRASKVCLVLQEWWSKEIQKFKVYFPANVASSLWEKPRIA